MVRRSGLVLGAALVVAATTPLLRRVARSWPLRVTVHGHSMEPALRDGDWLLVDPARRASHRIEHDELVVMRDPRLPERLLVKRVVGVSADRSLSVAGDHPAHHDDANTIGPVQEDLVVGRPWLRYWPPTRMGIV